jgi:hypothetical protein
MKQEVIDAAITSIETSLAECSIEKLAGLGELKQALSLANGMKALRAALTKEVVTDLLLPLQGSALGFRTDEDKNGGYGWEIVRDCAIEAFVRGYSPVGNEWNIIAARVYATKEGLDRKLREFPDLTDVEYRPGVPHLPHDKGALVPYTVRYRYKGQRGEIVCDFVRDPKDAKVILGDQRIPVRVNGGMGADAILGKARRKIMAKLLDRLLGGKITTPDGDIGEAADVLTTAEPAPTNGDVKESKSAQEAALQEVLSKHKPATNGAPAPDAKPTPSELAADEHQNSGK